MGDHNVIICTIVKPSKRMNNSSTRCVDVVSNIRDLIVSQLKYFFFYAFSKREYLFRVYFRSNFIGVNVLNNAVPSYHSETPLSYLVINARSYPNTFVLLLKKTSVNFWCAVTSKALYLCFDMADSTLFTDIVIRVTVLFFGHSCRW